MPSPLPTPSRHDLTRSAQLGRRIADDIGAQGGWISFARFMQACLYTPQLGYYSSSRVKLGHGPQDGSDFVTAPELSPLFGRALARPIVEICACAPQVLEFGAGSGALCCALLGELERLDALPQSYAILEVSADLREQQRAAIERRIPHLAKRVVWLDRLPERLAGALLANEVLDAMPVHLMVHADGVWHERGVGVKDDGALTWIDRPASAQMAAAIAARVPHDFAPDNVYLTELNLAATGWVASIADRLERGAMLLIDYGFTADEYFHPQRGMGTLMAHYRHRAHGEALLWPGLQDLTAHVDFSALAHSGVAHGLEILGFTSQANFLLNCGIAGLIEADPANARAWLPQANAVQRLVSEAEMGELFKVLALGRGLPAPLNAFRRGDRSARL